MRKVTTKYENLFKGTPFTDSTFWNTWHLHSKGSFTNYVDKCFSLFDHLEFAEGIPLLLLKVRKSQKQIFLRIPLPKKQIFWRITALAPFQNLGQKSFKNFVCFWSNGVSRKISFEIAWPGRICKMLTSQVPPKGRIFSEKYWYPLHCPKIVLCSILSFVFWIFPPLDAAVQLESADS